MADTIINEDEFSQYFNNLIKGRRIPCYNIINELIAKSFNIKTLYQDLMQRSLYVIGQLWEYNKITVATEHMATLITESLMNQISAQSPIGQSVNKTAVITSVEDEPHQIGSKMVADILELNGWNAICLGANTPIEELINFTKEIKPDLVGLSMSVYFHMETLKKTLQLLNENFKEMPLIVGGQALRQSGDSIIRGTENSTYIPNLDALEDYIKNFQQVREKVKPT
ncbi:MAG: cobalamin-dependent protein [Desulfamplus sp.]|nr:cobalamin-dependent protein [Desulfamplus sp.]